MPRAKRTIIIQKDLRDKIKRARDIFGASPGKSPTFTNLKRKIAIRSENTAIPPIRPRHGNQARIKTVKRGPRIRLEGGASCCTARALPQSGLLTIAVMIAVIEGRLRPAAIPSTSIVSLIVESDVTKMHAKRAMDTPVRERISVPLWLILDERKPEQTDPENIPKELTRNIEPACPELICSSSLITGRRGEKMNLLMNVRKKTRVRNRIFHIMDLKVSGIGHDLSDIKPPRILINLNCEKIKTVYNIVKN